MMMMLIFLLNDYFRLLHEGRREERFNLEKNSNINYVNILVGDEQVGVGVTIARIRLNEATKSLIPLVGNEGWHRA